MYISRDSSINLRRDGGFTLIEVLIAMFVLAIGIMGAGAMQTIGLQNSMAAFTRSQAMFIAGDVVDRLRNNRNSMSAYVGTYTASSTSVVSTCIADPAGCSTAGLVNSDLYDLVGYLQPIASGGLLPGGTVTVSSAGNVYTVLVSWTERESQAGTFIQNSSAAKSYSVSVNLAGT